ncbi:sensor domain-containing diguanylate cyclase [Reinekea marinisedimentorum]|uniref:diguanylate cyclase n=1 Tax=Reinekea marinisedimentorum TaxID=230495 RepID=A0A4V2UKC0_9GAMM|nr:sensor domain-containing diguanylate cyclase [Reinekea marinisedimentorum]TCS43713.1 diguanylate cyclase (GGDEF)-like protein [Reinekea marinisedimentorum]
MQPSLALLASILDSLSEHLVVIDRRGVIQYVNRSWMQFGQSNACAVAKSWQGVNYLAECDSAAQRGDSFGVNAAAGIRAVITRQQDEFYFEYPCHSPHEKRWFLMRVSTLSLPGEPLFIISHLNITERKLAEETAIELSRNDGLTGLANRRYFNEFLNAEWRRCQRLKAPVTLAIMDLDFFKQINDRYGHQLGDQCLQRIGELLSHYANRPNDICARYGGEEFALVYSGSELPDIATMMETLLAEIRELAIENSDSKISTTLTASIGMASMIPKVGDTELELIRKADMALYAAKKNGRDQLYLESPD